MLSNRWAVDDSYPINYIPRGVRLTAYAGSADDLPAPVLQATAEATTNEVNATMARLHAGFDAWDATPIIDDFAAFLASMGSGAVLFHGWRLKPAEANDRYDLKGFAEMLAAARAACPG